MKRHARGFALAVALAAIVVLAALATLAQFSAVAAQRDSAILRDAVQASFARDAMRARLASRLATATRAELVGHAIAIGATDTILTVTPLAWPWHRALVSAGGTALVAEVTRGTSPSVPWCAPGVIATGMRTAGAFVSAAPGSGCVDSVVVAPGIQIGAFDGALATDLVLGQTVDTLFVTVSDPAPRVRRARVLIVIEAGQTVLGAVSAPTIRLAPLATVRGLVVARDSLILEPGASLVAEPGQVQAAFASTAALRPVGKRGLLLPP